MKRKERKSKERNKQKNEDEMNQNSNLIHERKVKQVRKESQGNSNEKETGKIR